MGHSLSSRRRPPQRAPRRADWGTARPRGPASEGPQDGRRNEDHHGWACLASSQVEALRRRAQQEERSSSAGAHGHPTPPHAPLSKGNPGHGRDPHSTAVTSTEINAARSRTSTSGAEHAVFTAACVHESRALARSYSGSQVVHVALPGQT